MNLQSILKTQAFAPIGGHQAVPQLKTKSRAAYLAALTWAFTLFNSIRVLAYLPTVVAIIQSGNSDQHSLWTWFSWVGANATMACWLYEQNGQKVNRAVMVNTGNTVMCAVTLALILVHRF